MVLCMECKRIYLLIKFINYLNELLFSDYDLYLK